MTIHINVEQSRFESILSIVSPSGAEEINKQNLPDTFSVDDWNHFTLGLISSKFFMVMNKKELVFDMIDLPQADNLSGNVGVGINGMKAEFSDIEMDCMVKDNFMKFIESLRKKDELSPDAITDEEIDSSSGGSGGQEENPNLKEDGQLIKS